MHVVKSYGYFNVTKRHYSFFISLDIAIIRESLNARLMHKYVMHCSNEIYSIQV